ncbi:hypothetical protein [Halobacillus naozhouensis]|uniref:Uncharacterized protein n=1 Tax=Halobacillus naozhouensis TaxID=554880 RepID=A0ABY8IY00_9BACI|nr:hypothetical protein [Halobacillus naozhouensis]WFT75122.1 hypothetical protein P9989_01560 [Halobacillus naozhouensis]
MGASVRSFCIYGYGVEIYGPFLTKLKEDEWLASFYLSPIIKGEEAAPHLYFNTFKLIDNEWQLVRSYIETGVVRPT